MEYFTDSLALLGRHTTCQSEYLHLVLDVDGEVSLGRCSNSSEMLDVFIFRFRVSDAAALDANYAVPAIADTTFPDFDILRSDPADSRLVFRTGALPFSNHFSATLVSTGIATLFLWPCAHTAFGPHIAKLHGMDVLSDTGVLLLGNGNAGSKGH